MVDDTAAVLYVRISNDLTPDEFEQRLQGRKPRFMDVPGLVQKVYGRDPKTGDVCGIYFFQDQAALEAFRKSDLAKSIPEAYEATDVRREEYEVLFTLRPEHGPLTV